jgi:hypothetical protein
LHRGEVLQRLIALVGSHARSPTTELEAAARSPIARATAFTSRRPELRCRSR